MKLLIILLKFLFFLTVIAMLTGLAGLAFVYYRIEPELPSIETLRDVQLQVPLRIYSTEGKLIAEYGEKRRIPLGYEDIPQRMRQAFISAEDDRYFKHPGVDYHALLRAALQLVLTGERKQGGSTITMQVARNFFLTREKTFTRKLKEIFLALRIERDLSKQEILELYLNKIYLGNRAYGIGAASQVYYGLNVKELDLAQIAMLAGLPKAPSSNNPIVNPTRALERRAYVLGRMHQLGFISSRELEKANSEPISARLHSTRVEVHAPYVAEMARAEVVSRYGESSYTEGFNIQTSLNSRLQVAANNALRGTIQSYDKRHGYRGVAGHVDNIGTKSKSELLQEVKGLPTSAGLKRGLVTAVAKHSVELLLDEGIRANIDWNGLKWAQPYISVDRLGSVPKRAVDVLKTGDLIYLREEQDNEGQPFWRLAQIPAVEGALVAIDPVDGSILALAGGYDFNRSKFNRVTQARRQPGSGFKAFIYSAALEAGFSPASLINDAPLVVRNAGVNGDWRPKNYSGKWYGLTRMRVGLYKSRNMISIRLMRAMGIDFTIEHAARFGFDADKLPRNLTLALGSGEVTPLEMARGYAVLANGGFLVEPYFIDRIEKGGDTVLYQASPPRVCVDCDEHQQGSQPAPEDLDEEQTASVSPSMQVERRVAPRVLDQQNQYLMTSMLKDVIQRGTGTLARSLNRSDLAGKTGTSNDQRDAWFNGFNQNLVAIAWVGFDSFAPLGRKEVGGRVALPAWIDFMRVALEGVEEHEWELPEGIVSVRIDPDTGSRMGSDAEDTIFEVFREENLAQQPVLPVAPITSSTAATETEKFGALNQELF